MKLEKLLEETSETYYWIGFLLADGHFDYKKSRIRISLSIKDKDHLKKFCNYIERKKDFRYYSRNGKEYINLEIGNKKVFSELILKFNIYSNKTKNPPNIDILSKLDIDLNICLFIGFIDGDGYIFKRQNSGSLINIQVDKTWLNVLDFYRKLINEKFKYQIPKAKICNRGHSTLLIGNVSLVKNIKTFAIIHNLPYLDRKWQLIDENYLTRKETTDFYINEVSKLRSNGLSRKEISELLQISIRRVDIFLYRSFSYRKNVCEIIGKSKVGRPKQLYPDKLEDNHVQ